MMSESFASGARSSQGVVFSEGGGLDLASTWRPMESRSSQRTEGERDPAICGTDMVDMSQMVPGSDGAEAGSTFNVLVAKTVK